MYTKVTNGGQELIPYKFEFKPDINRIKKCYVCLNFESRYTGKMVDAMDNVAVPSLVIQTNLIHGI
jgi:hypothetical protein